MINYRKCVGCSKVLDRDEMLRILIKNDTKEIVIAPSNKVFGRSVYICKNQDCINSAFKKGRINRYIKNADINTLKEQISNLLIN